MATANAAPSASAASYIEHMLGELRGMSERIDAEFLSYLIEMAMIEASDIAKGAVSSANADGTKRTTNEIQRLYMSDEL